MDENQRIFYLLLKFLSVKFETCKFVGFSEKTENCPRSNMWSKLVTSARIRPWWGQPTECWGQGWWFRGITVSRFLKVTGKYSKICFTITVKHSCSEVPKTSGFELWYHNSFIRQVSKTILRLGGLKLSLLKAWIHTSMFTVTLLYYTCLFIYSIYSALQNECDVNY